MSQQRTRLPRNIAGPGVKGTDATIALDESPGGAAEAISAKPDRLVATTIAMAR